MNVRSIIIVLLLFISLTAISKAQTKTLELGIMGGTSYYTGDINHSKLFYSPEIAYGVVYKRIFNDHNNIRAQIAVQNISGSDASFNSGYQQARNHSFRNSIYEFGLQHEFNFFPFNPASRNRATPYITSGASIIVIAEPRYRYRPAVPIGIGFKIGAGKRMTIAAEWTYKFAFDNNLDAIPEYTTSSDQSLSDSKQTMNLNTRDWYSLAGIIISYNFASTKSWCPAYNVPKK